MSQLLQRRKEKLARFELAEEETGSVRTDEDVVVTLDTNKLQKCNTTLCYMYATQLRYTHCSDF